MDRTKEQSAAAPSPEGLPPDVIVSPMRGAPTDFRPADRGPELARARLEIASRRFRTADW